MKKSKAADDQATVSENESYQEMAPVDPIQMTSADSLLISYERTPCFGRCPVFKIKVYESGYTTYQGVNFVEYMGYFYSRVSSNTLEKIKKTVQASDYFNLEDRYDNDHITDLPSKIYQVNMDGVNKRIIARVDSPEALNNLGQEIEKIFEGTAWKAVTTDY